MALSLHLSPSDGAPPEVDRLAAELENDEGALARAIQQALARSEKSRLLLVVDQFEELFTRVRSESARRMFIANLLHATSALPELAMVVVVMRADYYAECFEYPDLLQALSAHQVLVGPMNLDELRQAIVGSAQAVGLAYEKGLVARILEDVIGEPGALPLLQYTLMELWDR